MTPRDTWNPADYVQNASFVAALGAPVVELLELARGAHVLDLGCGDGTLTEELARRGYRVLGADASPAMVAAARARGLEAEVADAAALSFEARFDGVFSNATLHWVRDQDAMCQGVARALKAGGAFVGELGGAGNIAHVRNALHAALRARHVDPERVDPWTFPTPAQFASSLERAGFRVAWISLFDRPTPLPGDVRAWLTTFAQRFLDALPAAEHARFLTDVRARLVDTLADAHGAWTLDYVRLRFSARKPAQH